MTGESSETKVYRGTTDAEMIRAFLSEAAEAAARGWAPAEQRWETDGDRRTLVVRFESQSASREGEAADQGAASPWAPAPTAVPAHADRLDAPASASTIAPASGHGLLAHQQAADTLRTGWPADASALEPRPWAPRFAPSAVDDAAAAAAGEKLVVRAVLFVVGLFILLLFIAQGTPDAPPFDGFEIPIDPGAVDAPAEADVPALIVLEPSDGDLVASPMLLVRGNAGAGDSIRCSAAGTSRSGTAASDGSWLVGIVLAPGANTVTCTDQASGDEVELLVTYEAPGAPGSVMTPGASDPGDPGFKGDPGYSGDPGYPGDPLLPSD